ncbi:hypothetical protein A0H81_09064 [Grifola frondosa]|uniref:PH domain-containing protein n=1 Tax=Grifola frondosa TaxID=5627 RepID=A0A1C7M1N5_GRIFR|nr:hypothetical protein A0H81_09064 [Grifola frondosa]
MRESRDEGGSLSSLSDEILTAHTSRSLYIMLQNPVLSLVAGRTKELIGRYESMDTSAKPAAGKRTPSRRNPPTASFALEKKDKSRSPIRQSFRNLISVFKKNKSSGKDHSQQLAVPGTKYRSNDVIDIRTQNLALPQLPRVDICSVKPDKALCITPISLHSGQAGPLLYLSRPLSPNVLPVWTSCTAQLHSTHIIVTWHSAHGNPSTYVVPFTACTDVRSLALTDLDATERSLLPDRPELRVFEMLFEGRAREKFAADSVTERASWVSAIWDGVLQAQEDRIRTPSVIGIEGAIESPFSVASPVGPPHSLAHSRLSVKTDIPSPTSSSIDRALPAIPIETRTPSPSSSARFALRDSAPTRPSLSPLPKPPVTPTPTRSSFQTPPRPSTPARSQSPSIRNLDQRSVVRQRLAQIEGNGSGESPPTGSPRPRRQNSTASSMGRSILNSYGGPDPASPLSVDSGRLTSDAGTPRTRTNRWANEIRTSGLHLSVPAPRKQLDDGDRSARIDIKENMAKQPIILEEDSHHGTAFSHIQSMPFVASDCPTSREVVVDTAIHEMLDSIDHTVKAVEGRSVRDGAAIDYVRATVTTILEELHRQSAVQGSAGGVDPSEVMQKLEGIQAEFKSDLPGLVKRIEDLVHRERDSSGAPTTEQSSSVLHAKLDNLVELCQGLRGNNVGDNPSAASTGHSEEISEVLDLLKDAQVQRSTQSEQQTDSVRYLNELNSWLEAFVNHGTSQIDGMAAGIQQLCRELGPIPELQDPPEEGGATPAESLLTHIRRLLVENRSREEGNATLQASVNGLVAAVQEDLRRNAEARNMLIGCRLIDRQRQDQERMLRSLATELSNDIRGERLRFVEAMKEATAINVQIHVEEFKKELTREVLIMTQEVGRLQRERQGLEQQIADLFAFYAKQKQAGKLLQPSGDPPPNRSSRQPTPLTPGATLPSMRRRPLPSPTPRLGSAQMSR